MSLYHLTVPAWCNSTVFFLRLPPMLYSSSHTDWTWPMCAKYTPWFVEDVQMLVSVCLLSSKFISSLVYVFVWEPSGLTLYDISCVTIGLVYDTGVCIDRLLVLGLVISWQFQTSWLIMITPTCPTCTLLESSAAPTLVIQAHTSHLAPLGNTDGVQQWPRLSSHPQGGSVCVCKYTSQK